MIFLVKITNGDTMSKEIDLQKYQLRTDLAVEAKEMVVEQQEKAESLERT